MAESVALLRRRGKKMDSQLLVKELPERWLKKSDCRRDGRKCCFAEEREGRKMDSRLLVKKSFLKGG
ncbi:hypothetical protein CEXT_584541 [Caerostris extrusa]|uniref:Uncharacterized protein n=1 Tax=Caerostris extrusa TaxID=172846 RepID=A0AAV4U6Y3_CAEEX|nr:hypothetical protein CEXT_584541 [Caerostris extrusa]